MKKWRYISGVGVILGIVAIVIDSGIESIPDAIIILLEIVSIILLFAGLLIRKSEKTREK